MPESGSLGSVRGALSNGRPYREQTHEPRPMGTEKAVPSVARDVAWVYGVTVTVYLIPQAAAGGRVSRAGRGDG